MMKPQKKFLFGLYLVLMISGLCFCENQFFTLVFMENRDYQKTSCGNKVSLFLAATKMTKCLISAPKTNLFEQSYTVSPSEVIKVPLPRSLAMSGSGVQQKGILVSCNCTITLYGINTCSYSSDGFFVIPNDHLGREYYAFTVFPTEIYSQVAIVGYLDNTNVTIHLRCTDCNVRFNSFEYRPGSFITEVLNAYECLQIQSSDNLSGTYISSNNPISVFSGNVRSGYSTIYVDSSKEHLVLHLPPVQSWGKKFVAVSTPAWSTTTSISDILFVVASADYTNCSILCTGTNAPNVHQHVVKAGQIIQTDILSDNYCLIETNETVLAVQTISPEEIPSFLLLTPIDQYSTNYSFMSPKTSQNEKFINYFVYVIDESAASGLMLDYRPIQIHQYSKIPGTRLIGGYFNVPDTDNAHHVTHQYANFNGAVLGFAGHESYATSLGWKWKDSQNLLSSAVQTSLDATKSILTAIKGTTDNKGFMTTNVQTLQGTNTKMLSNVQASQGPTKQMSSDIQVTQGKGNRITATVQATQHASTDWSTAMQETHDTKPGSSTTVPESQFTNKATNRDATKQQFTNPPGSTGGSYKPAQEFSKCLCPCSLVSTKWQNILNGILSNEELVKLILDDFEQNIKPFLMIERKKLSKTKRNKISVMNTDATELCIGWGFAWIVAIPVIFAVLSDLLNLCRFCARKMRRNNRTSP